MAVAASAVTNVTAASTTALAASTRPRRGLAASVVRISPRRYSAVMNMTPITTIAISPANVPARVCSDAAGAAAGGRGDVTRPGHGELAAGLREPLRRRRTAPYPAGPLDIRVRSTAP